MRAVSASVSVLVAALATINRGAAFAYSVYALGLPHIQDALVQLALGSSTGAMLALVYKLRAVPRPSSADTAVRECSAC